MGGGGGDGYEARQADTERRKQLARAELNATFGAGTPEGIAAVLGPAPDRSAFTRPSGTMQRLIDGENPVWDTIPDPNSPSYFDEAGYNQALTNYNAKQSSVRSNAQSRDSLYQGVRDNAFNAGKRRLDEAEQDAARKLKFELFATGQAGGSGDVDENAKLKRTYTQGLMDLGAKADSAKADFRNSDEDTRLQLLQSIDNGMDQGSALSAATQRMQIAADKAAADANGTAVGDLFATGGEFYNQSQMAKGRQAGQQRAWEMFPQQGPGGARKGASASGVVTRLPGD